MSVVDADLEEEVLEDNSDSTWTRREQARQRQIAIGKARPEYRRYVQEVPCEHRDPSHPSTPDPRDRISKRQFDRTLSKWRCRLHEYDVPRTLLETSRIDAENTPSHRHMKPNDALDTTATRAPSEFSEQRSDGIVSLRLAEALGAPATPQVGPHAQSHVIAVGQFQLQLGPRQLDFGVGPKQAWQGSPMDGTPSTMCTLSSPMTPAPRAWPAFQNARQQTVFENSTPNRMQQPLPSASFSPPRTPPRKTLEHKMAEVVGSESTGFAMSPPSSIPKTPIYGAWARNTPSRSPVRRVTYAETNTFRDHRSHGLEMPPMPTQPLQFSMHQPMPWGMYGQC